MAISIESLQLNLKKVYKSDKIIYYFTCNPKIIDVVMNCPEDKAVLKIPKIFKINGNVFTVQTDENNTADIHMDIDNLTSGMKAIDTNNIFSNYTPDQACFLYYLENFNQYEKINKLCIKKFKIRVVPHCLDYCSYKLDVGEFEMPDYESNNMYMNFGIRSETDYYSLTETQMNELIESATNAVNDSLGGDDTTVTVEPGSTIIKIKTRFNNRFNMPETIKENIVRNICDNCPFFDHNVQYATVFSPDKAVEPELPVSNASSVNDDLSDFIYGDRNINLDELNENNIFKPTTDLF